MVEPLVQGLINTVRMVVSGIRGRVSGISGRTTGARLINTVRMLESRV